MLIHVMSLHEWFTLVGRIRPSVIRDKRCPTRPTGILVVGIRTELAIKILVSGELLPIESHTEARPLRHTDRPLVIFEFPSLDDIVFEMVIVSVSRKPEVRHNGAKVKHRRQLNTELTRGVHRDSKLKCL